MFLELPEPLHAFAWATLFSLLGAAAWLKKNWKKKVWSKKNWPKIEFKTERQVENGFEVTDVALRYWRSKNNHGGPPDIEFSNYTTLKREMKNYKPRDPM
jgi:hypothetical protein